METEAVTLARYVLFGSLITAVTTVTVLVLNLRATARKERSDAAREIRRVEDERKQAEERKLIAVQVTLAAEKAEEVKQTLAAKTIITDDKLDTIHLLVNSEMGKQKQKTAIRSRKLADLTSLPEDMAIAEEDEEIYKAHMMNQKVVTEMVKNA